MACARSIPDDLIHDILVRLPATAVLRFRAVCKQWRAIVDDPRFPSAHHRHRPPMPLLCLRHDDPPDHPTTPRHFRVRLEAIDLRACATCPVIRFTAPARRDYERRVPRPGTVIGSALLGPDLVRDEGDFQVHGSCDGVLLVSYKAGAYLCNPARRRWTNVPAGTSDGIVGFYMHRPSGEFRVLRRSRYNTGNIDYDYRVMTLRPTNTWSWRGITGGPHSDKLLATIRIRPAFESPPALVAGNLHWLPQPDSSSDLLVFDPVFETFRRMRPPPTVEEVDDQAQALLELDGKLTMTLTRGDLATAELWVLQDYEREDSWTCRLQIPLPPEPDIVRDRPGAVTVVSLEGDVIVQCAQCLLQCDAKGRVRMRHQPAEHHRIIAVPHLFTESLVPHSRVDGREIITGYEGIEYPPFFVECNCYLHSESSKLE